MTFIYLTAALYAFAILPRRPIARIVVLVLCCSVQLAMLLHVRENVARYVHAANGGIPGLFRELRSRADDGEMVRTICDRALAEWRAEDMIDFNLQRMLLLYNEVNLLAETGQARNDDD